MQRRKLRIEIDFDDTDSTADDRYADAANAIWMVLKAMSEPDRFDFRIHHDGDHAVGKKLNARWDDYGKEARWS